MKTMIKERIIPAKAKDVYLKWTTKDGLNTFFSQDNDIEIKPGGKYEIYFTTDKSIKHRGSEGCKVLSFTPNHTLSFTWNVPPTFESLRQSEAQTRVLLEFIEMDNHTLLRLTNSGYLEGEAWELAYEYFNKAWDYVLDNLVKSFK